jgi:hypothetical protein
MSDRAWMRHIAVNRKRFGWNVQKSQGLRAFCLTDARRINDTMATARWTGAKRISIYQVESRLVAGPL